MDIPDLAADAASVVTLITALASAVALLKGSGALKRRRGGAFRTVRQALETRKAFVEAGAEVGMLRKWDVAIEDQIRNLPSSQERATSELSYAYSGMVFVFSVGCLVCINFADVAWEANPWGGAILYFASLVFLVFLVAVAIAIYRLPFSGKGARPLDFGDVDGQPPAEGDAERPGAE